MKRSIYLGGEKDSVEDVIPNRFEDFFSMFKLTLTLIVLSVFALGVVIWTLL